MTSRQGSAALEWLLALGVLVAAGLYLWQVLEVADWMRTATGGGLWQTAIGR